MENVCTKIPNMLKHHCLFQALCTAMAVLLQYIYLVVFFLMLAEGIEIGITVLYVFVTKSRLKWILPAAWGEHRNYYYNLKKRF